MKTTLKVNDLTFVFSTQAKAQAFIKELGALILKHEENKFDCYMQYEFLA